MLSNKTVVYGFILSLTFLSVNGCGFRLRGSIEAPEILKEIHITGIAEYSALNQELRKVLQRSGTKFLDSPERALSVISFQNEGFTRRVLSVDAQGRVAEYELIYRFQFSVTSDNKDLVPMQNIEIFRDYRFDPNNVLAKDAEEAQIRKEMIKFSVRQMMRRIESHLKQS